MQFHLSFPMRRWVVSFGAIGALLLPGTVAGAETPRGHLFIIGGGDRPPALMRQFVELAGGADHARIRIIPNSSGSPRTRGEELTEEFKALGVRDVSYVLYTRAQAEQEGAEKAFDGATGVFFSGGDQIRVTRALLHTPVHRKLHALYQEGAVLGGTSAGAAIMSRVMITGDETINKDTLHLFPFIRKGNVVTVEGMGFVENAIIDQHFIYRKRHNRLLTVVLEHPTLVGVGIDESTAIILSPNNTFTVTGEGTVIVFDATAATPARTDPAGNLAASGILTHVLMRGDVYDLSARRVLAGKTLR